MTEPILPIMIGIDGTSGSDDLADYLKKISPCGIILFARNLNDKIEVREFTGFLRETLPYPLLIAIDQEGGSVSRLSSLGFSFPGAEELAGGKNLKKIEEISGEMGSILRDLGITLNLAPVADLKPLKDGTGLEGRTYGNDPVFVSECAEAFIAGQKKYGILTCLKHFPGLGDTDTDTHLRLPVVNSIKEKLMESDWIPYFNVKSDFAMVGHASYKCFGSGLTPATLKSETYTVLRDEIGFNGLIISDDLQMGALSGYGSLKERVVGCLNAGADLAIIAKSDGIIEVRDAFMNMEYKR